MTTGKKRSRIVKGSKARVKGSKSAVESTHTNPYLYFLDAYQKKAKVANKGPRFIIAKYSKSAGEVWKKMSDAEKRHSWTWPKKERPALMRIRLVNHFNPVTKSLEFRRVRVYTITLDDVRRVLGLSCGTIAVPTDCEDNHFGHIRKMFAKGKKPLKRGVTFAMTQQVFKTGVSDVKFQTSYVLVVLSCLLYPTTKDVAATRFYPTVHNLTQTPTYAWAEFVFDWLVKEIAKYKKRSAKAADSKNKKDALGVGGCVLLLMVGSAGDPMIQSWTTKLIKERIAKEETLELLDPISGQFPEPCFQHSDTIAAYHDLKKSFLVQMQHLFVLDGALMGDVPKICTRNPSKWKASNERQSLNKGKDVTKRKNPNDDDVEMDDVDMDLEEIPSTSTLNPKKVSDGVDVEDMDAGCMSGFDDLVFGRKMPFYSPKHMMADVVQHVEVEVQSVAEKQVEKEGEEKCELEDDHIHVQEEEEEEEVEEEEQEVEEEVPLTPPLNKRPRTRLQKSKFVTRPSTKRGKRTLKPSKATKMLYVAPSELKQSKLTKQETQVWVYVMQPPKKIGDETDGGKIHLSHDMLHKVFKARGHMSTMVMATMTEWLMKEEKAKNPMKDGVPSPTRHMFSSYFVLLDKRIEVLDSMVLNNTDMKVATFKVDHVGIDAIVVRKRLLVRLVLSPHNQLQDVVLTRLLK
ncbi:hypothetical protein RHGRI_030944 [Rhododendron griersonianum]|uniref:HMG box domain-containing protein n=1 Tax=Rhododendron griersonianum TaxID=479676 RepID=A0AAV6I6J6_9ERIC|nr:hypothetical protein RHGRI_030944 [Rhododendron griersonianum]